MVVHVEVVQRHREWQLTLLHAAVAAHYRVGIDGHPAAQVHHAALARDMGNECAGQYEQQRKVQGYYR